MLLLVLMFVLAAFGLLLIALVTGTAAWAWVSVVVSVAAAGVLVFDWAKRRAAVGDGDRVGAPLGVSDVVDPPTTMIPALGSRTEPVTEVFPALRTSVAASGTSGVEYARRDGAGDSQAAPSGSSGQPSGAGPDQNQTNADSSLNVTELPPSHPTEQNSTFAARTGDDPLRSPSAADSTEKLSDPESDEPADPTADGTTDVRSSRTGEPDRAEPDRAEPARAEPDRADPDRSGASPTSGGSSETSGAGGRADGTEETTVVRPQVPAAASSDHTETVGLFSPLNPVVPPRADDAEATQAIPASTPEQGEERAEPAAAAIVASLEDEVLVVDEQPRYHLAECRSLVGRETIALPAKEAVEYEFTPCASCSPVRVLAARNRAASNS